jgi:lipoprotein-releasing system ATP-binding protein
MLRVESLCKSYPAPAGSIDVLRDVTFSVDSGQAAAITGPSGSGKSTLLYVVGALESPTSGSVSVDDRRPFDLPAAELARFRNRSVGFVFQDHCLLSQCTALENVLTPTLVAPPDAAAPARARQLLERVGLAGRADHRPSELSGGEKQRVAIARALINRPRLILCDEPTGNLDRHNADAVASLLLELNDSGQTLLLVVTHSAEIARRMPLRFELVDGRLIGTS